MYNNLKNLDPDVFNAIKGEVSRQNDKLELNSFRKLC